MSVDDEISAIWEEFPEAEEFADLITASDIESYRDVAQQIALKVRRSNTNKPSSTPRTPRPDKEKVTSVEEAISAKSWPDYLHAKWEAAGRA
jgi:hypothetical protein